MVAFSSSVEWVVPSLVKRRPPSLTDNLTASVQCLMRSQQLIHRSLTCPRVFIASSRNSGCQHEPTWAHWDPYSFHSNRSETEPRNPRGRSVPRVYSSVPRASQSPSLPAPRAHDGNMCKRCTPLWGNFACWQGSSVGSECEVWPSYSGDGLACSIGA